MSGSLLGSLRRGKHGIVLFSLALLFCVVWSRWRGDFPSEYVTKLVIFFVFLGLRFRSVKESIASSHLSTHQCPDSALYLHGKASCRLKSLPTHSPIALVRCAISGIGVRNPLFLDRP